jgi:hypothetical protein
VILEYKLIKENENNSNRGYFENGYG